MEALKNDIMIDETLYEAAPDEIEATRRLFQIVRILRRLCPWDSVQTHDSLRICMLEEAYEAVDAVINQDMDNYREELGDVMLQVVLNGIIAEESGSFNLTQVINDECEKMIRRHPHIFGDAAHKDIDKILEKWENIKGNEHGESSVSQRLASVPKALPALMRAGKVLTKVQRADLVPENFMEAECGAYEPREQVAARLCTVSSGLKQSLQQGRDDLEEIIGELLFLVADAARLAGIDPEAALNARTQRYVDHFTELEQTGRDNK